MTAEDYNNAIAAWGLGIREWFMTGRKPTPENLITGYGRGITKLEHLQSIEYLFNWEEIADAINRCEKS